jgi:hypothetical protein
MSWRIETADPFALMPELPEQWAQTCLLRPPRDLPVPLLVASLDHVHRVLRQDGTLWVALPGRGSAPMLLRAIEAAGWLRAPAQLGGGSLRGVALFSKQPRFHFTPRQAPLASLNRPGEVGSGSLPARRTLRRTAARRAWCVPVRGTDALSLRLIEWCILAGSSPHACGECGAPYKRLPARPGRPERWRPGCSHTNGRGRCLVLDPFCGLAPTGVAAVRLGRSYLGVERNTETARRARRRLTGTEPEARR